MPADPSSPKMTPQREKKTLKSASLTVTPRNSFYRSDDQERKKRERRLLATADLPVSASTPGGIWAPWLRPARFHCGVKLVSPPFGKSLTFN